MTDTIDRDIAASTRLNAEAMDLAKKGDWDAAWKTARLDPLLDLEATREHWMAWAKSKIAAPK